MSSADPGQKLTAGCVIYVDAIQTKNNGPFQGGITPMQDTVMCMLATIYLATQCKLTVINIMDSLEVFCHLVQSDPAKFHPFWYFAGTFT